MVDLVVHKPKKQQDISKVFGIMQDDKIDGLEFQQKLRDEW
jgi:hypothetical protein